MRNLLKRPFLLTVVLLLVQTGVVLAVGGGDGNPDLRTPAESLKRFKSLKFGTFIHWNPACQAGHEISFARATDVPREKYDNLYKTFNPEKFNASEWVRTLKEAGFKYFVFVPKHHDGFCMWNTKTTEYNIMNSPFGRDVVKELSDECKKQELVFSLYYSIADWYQPDYEPKVYKYSGPGWEIGHGGSGYSLPEGQNPDFDRYVKYMKAQLKELTENYGPILTWWLDGQWGQTWTKERGTDLYAYMRKLQPDVLLNNRVDYAYDRGLYVPTWFPSEKNSAGDYAVQEVTMPRFNRDTTDIPWEYCSTIGYGQWSWKPHDTLRPTSAWIKTLIDCACRDGNYLLGLSATPMGRLEPRLVDQLREMGRWLERYGDSIYGTRGGPFKPNSWYGSTCKGNNIYLHVFRTDNGYIKLPALSKKIVSYRLMNGGDLNVEQTDKSIKVTIGEHDFQQTDTIVVFELNGSAEEIRPVEEQPVNVDVIVYASNIRQNKKEHFPELTADGSRSTYWTTDEGVNSGWIEYDLGKPCTFSRAVLDEAEDEWIRHIQIQAKVDGVWKTVSEVRVGWEGPGWSGYGDKYWDPWPLSVFIAEINFTPVTSQFVRLNIVKSIQSPVIHEFKLYER